MRGVKHVDDLVGIVAQIRESRDGLVETPAQFRFIADLLSISIKSHLNSSNNKNVCTPIHLNETERFCLQDLNNYYHPLFSKQNFELTTISVLLVCSLILSFFIILR